MTPEDQYVLALLYQTEGEEVKARSKLQELVQPTPGTPQYLAQYALSLLLSKKLPGDLDEAEKVIDRLAKLEKDHEVAPNTYASVEMRVRLLEARGKGDEALARIRKHVKRPGAKPDEMLLVLASLTRLKRYREALKECERAWKAKKCSPEAVGGVTVALLRVMKPTDAQVKRVEGYLTKAIEAHPQSTVLLMHLCDLHDQRGRYDDAVATYRKVLAQEPNNVVALNNLAWLLAQRSGDASEAMQYITTAVSGLGRRADLLDTRGLVHMALKQPDKAVADLKEATTDAPTPTRLFHLARAHHEARDRANARRVLRQAKERGLEVATVHPVEQETCRQLLVEYGIR
jgi:tetratricopeptide (TPR) repeat protein